MFSEIKALNNKGNWIICLNHLSLTNFHYFSIESNYFQLIEVLNFNLTTT